MQVYEAWSAERAAEIIAQHADQAGALLPILHGLQAAFGCIPEPAVPMIADALNLSRAEVHGVVTFYHDFRRDPPGRHVLKLQDAMLWPSAPKRSSASRLATRPRTNA
jgi:formate dehydrogenase subunit gamma